MLNGPIIIRTTHLPLFAAQYSFEWDFAENTRTSIERSIRNNLMCLRISERYRFVPETLTSRIDTTFRLVRDFVSGRLPVHHIHSFNGIFTHRYSPHHRHT